MIAPRWIFAYASLLDGRGAARPCRLAGYRRRWQVAMDNTVTIPGYKCYLAPRGDRPAVFVTFLDLVEAAGSTVNGVLLPVSPARLVQLDRRERNYRRIDVTELVDAPVRGRVATYVGTVEGRARFERGLHASTAVVAASYHDQVLAGFGARGARALAAFRASTDPLPCPLRPLRRVDLP